MRYQKLFPIREDINPINEFSRPSKSVLKSRLKAGVVWHYTAGDREPKAANIDNYFEGLKNQNPNDNIDDRYAGAHIQIDRIERVLSIPWDEGAYHCGAKTYKPGIQERFGVYPNTSTWGVEMCCATNEPLPEETFENAVDLGAWFIVETRAGGELAEYVTHPFTTNDFARHYDVTGKNCPKPWVEHPAEWTRFIAAVNQKVAEHDEGKSPQITVPEEDEDMDNVLDYPEWAWAELEDWSDKAWNDKFLSDWAWNQKIRDKKLTYGELLLLKVLLDERRRTGKTVRD